MTNRSETFICPICLAPHRTFGALMSCHGEELRQFTGHMAANDVQLNLKDIFTNNYSQTTRARLLTQAGVV